MRKLLLLCSLVAGLAVHTEGTQFELGFDHHYTYSSQSDILGLHNVTTVIKFRVRPVNHTSTGDALNLLTVDSFVQHSEKGYVADNPLKWDFDRVFYFTVNEGLVTLVHYHPEEIDELLSIKKVLASTLSARVRVNDGTRWSFKSTETDHTGTLVHSYEGEKQSDGIILSRTHRSTDRVHRAHDKKLYLDLKGTPLHIESVDNITLHDKKSDITRKSHEGIVDIEETEIGEFPKIFSISRSRMKLTVKSKHGEIANLDTGDLKQDSVIVKKKTKKKFRLGEVKSKLRQLVDCVHSYSNKYERNRTECVDQLSQLLYNLEKPDFLNVIRGALSRDCDVNDTLCVDERYLFIDLVGVEGSPESQELFLNLIMKQPNATEEQLRRCLFHCITLVNPIDDLVKHVETICLSEDAIPGETPTLTQTRKRACLSLGSMAKSLHKTNVTESDRIVEEIENWLQHHDQEKSRKIVKPRLRRAFNQVDKRANKHVETKMILLQSLGNAGKERSIQHIKSYMKPNVGVSAWRRAAIHSLRHFKCNESANALLTSAVHDDNEIVRKTARKVLEKHPQSANFTEEHENVVLSKNYTYPVVARVRRGIMQQLVQGIRVHIEPPGVEWGKLLGNENIGAGIGLQMRNIMDLKLGVLDGHFEIDVYDDAYAEAHMGMLNFKVEILKAYVCFNGHIRYDLNVLKDFGINSLEDMVHIYDKILGKIVDPLKEAIDGFKTVINMVKDGDIQKIFETFIYTVKHLPTILGDVANRMAAFVKKIFSIVGNTVVKEIQIIVKHIQDFVDGVKQDLLKFYHDVVDAVTMAMPYITKTIKEAFNLVLEAVTKIIDNPMQAITAMARAINDIKMSVTMMVDVKNKVIEACLFIKGRATEWMDTAKKIPSILQQMYQAFGKLTRSMITKRDVLDDITGAFSDGIEEAKASLEDMKTDLKAEWDNVIEPLKPLIVMTRPFVTAFKAVVKVIKGVKQAYKEMKRVIQTCKMIVQKVFGPKFHKDFPADRRQKKGNCKEGVYPSTDGGTYNTTGVEITLGIGQSIRNPVNGIVHVRHGNKVIISPADAEFNDFEVVIENINPFPKVDDKNFPAGIKIGRAVKSKRKCKRNSIHVSLRKANKNATSDADFDYIDPSKYLDRLVPVPKWIHHCKDYEFRFKGHTVDSGEAGDGGLGEESEDIKRESGHNALDSMLEGDDGTAYRPSDSSMFPAKPVKDQLLEQIKEQAKKFGDFFKKALFGDDGPKVPNILDVVDMNKKSVKWIEDQLEGTLKDKFVNVVSELKSRLTATPIGNPITFGIPYTREFLKMNGQKPTAGDVVGLSDSLMTMAGKTCPLFKGTISIGFGHVCTAHDDCMGIVCSVPIKLKSKENHIKIAVTAIPDKKTVEVAINDRVLEIESDGIDVELDSKVSFMGMKLYLVSNLESQNGVLSLDAELKLCVKLFSTCLPPIELFHNIKFTRAAQHIRIRRASLRDTVGESLQRSTIPSFIGKLGDFQLLTRDVTHILEDVRQTVVEKLLDSAYDKLGPITKEMLAKLDFCLDVSIPMPPMDIPFFHMGQLFFVGPVPLTLTFDAKGAIGVGLKLGLCVLSMKSEVTLIPFVGAKVKGEAAVNVGFAKAGIAVVGYLMETQFPLTTECVFSKYPIQVGKVFIIENKILLVKKRHCQYPGTMFDISKWLFLRNITSLPSINHASLPTDKLARLIFSGINYSKLIKLELISTKEAAVISELLSARSFVRPLFNVAGSSMRDNMSVFEEKLSRMDMELKPLTLVLRGFAELNFLFTTVTVFRADIWKYSVPMIRKNIFNKIKQDVDKSPPQIMPATTNTRKRREGPRGCILKQVAGRRFDDTAFSLEMYAEDEVSEIKLFYTIGTHKGGTNLVDWTEMGGSSLLVPIKLPGGIPLYWTVKARNSQGQETVTQCDLNTFDSTLPDGRVEHAYKFSSHPSKLVASVIAFEDSPLVETHFKAVGYSPGQFGSQFVDWQPLNLDHSVARSGILGPLSQFSIPREGKLVAWILQTQNTRTPDECAQKCLDYGSNCVSFDYEEHSETCDFHDVVEGANAYLRISGTYSNYERLGSGFHTPIEYNNLDLKHGSSYFVNTRVSNVLGYDAFLLGEGTMVDFSPPEPGLIMNIKRDVLRADGCTAAFSQKCVDVTWKTNHRIIEDGPGSATVFNGHEPLFDDLYTLTNHYVAANWKGFHDDESGIWGHTWAVGTNVCGTDIVAYEDPYSHLTSKKFWTDSAFHKGVHLNDGHYYVTIQALNGAELGGSLVTTVCHTTPFTVDTTPPVFNKVTDIIYDEDFDLIAIYYDAEDDLSKVAHAEFGLGKTKYDVQLKPYSLHAPMAREDPFVSVKDLGLQEGVPAWIRIRVTNNVDLFTAGHGDEPILIDKSPPIAGTVLDGDRLKKDLKYQASDEKICAQWVDFYDPESGIDRFQWGVGTEPQKFDIVTLRNLTRYEKSACAPASLQHNHTYFSTVLSYNSALNSKDSNSSSDGVLVDITPPLVGQVFDGKQNKGEQMYSSETVSKYANWKGFHDPESHIADYRVDVFINNEHKETFDTGTNTEFEDHTISMDHMDQVYFTVHGINGAELEKAADSNGFLVDLTPPTMSEIADCESGLPYQQENDTLHLKWHFKDDESYIVEYRTIIYETKYGVKQKFWPENDSYNSSVPSMSGRVTVDLDELNLQDGALYSLHVTALNGALLATSHESSGVTVDTTPPAEPKVHIGLPKDDEELDENGNILHDVQTAIRVSWTARDPESGIAHYRVAIGTKLVPESVLPFTDYGDETMAYIQNIHFETFSISNKAYVVSVIAVNGAGNQSVVGSSKPIHVKKANVPGIVFDGRDLLIDASYTIDHTSLAASFHGFDSETCNILSYEWAIGTKEYGADVLSYTDYGLVMLNDTHGQCQIHTELFEDTTYYITVRAVTGCRDQFILSTSDGITLDRTPPVIEYEVAVDNDTSTIIQNGVLYQDSIDTLAISSNVTDSNSIATTTWALGALPLSADQHAYTSDFNALIKHISLNNLRLGESLFLTTSSTDKAGNVNTTSSVAIIADTTSPLITNINCTKYISMRQSLLTCTWESVKEVESQFKEIRISIGTNANPGLILDGYSIPRIRQEFIRDLHTKFTLLGNTTKLVIGFVVTNVLGQKTQYGKELIYDHSEPSVESLDVVTSMTDTHSAFHMKCQVPTSYVELLLNNAVDKESNIDTQRFQVSIGSKPYGTDIVRYKSVTQQHDGTIFIDGFYLNPGKVFFASVRIYNQAGMYTDVASESVVISQSPYLSVVDGNTEHDIDFQSVPNIVQGQWTYSDLCPVREAYWSLRDLTENILIDYKVIPTAGKKFYNDEMLLENGKKYITVVKTIDFLNRTKIARSDGFTVRIQPPIPGYVRDGFAEDINYQYSITELSTNWDAFGDNTNDPTQLISHYEVAIGNDRRYEKTRSNVHFFVDVGLNRSYTFEHLNLTAKLVRYYITVRAYSNAGGYAEAYTNGIRVGFDDDIVPGEVSVKPFQSVSDSISVSWSGYRSDIGIIQYNIGISSHLQIITNDTLSCRNFEKNKTMFDIWNMQGVGLNEYALVKSLTLQHNHNYFVTVIAEDEAGMCISVTSEPVLVDTTDPVRGGVLVNNVRSSTVLFATSNSELHVAWHGFEDPESGIKNYKVTLFECLNCKLHDGNTDECYSIAETVAENDNQTAFYELDLQTKNTYYVSLDVHNNAGLETHIKTPTILIDTSPPLTGSVKISQYWNETVSFQKSTTEITGQLAIANTLRDYLCPSQKSFFPLESNHRGDWKLLAPSYTYEFTVVNRSGAFLGIGFNTELTELSKSGVMSDYIALNKGNYTFRLIAAKGQNIITSIALLTDNKAIPYAINDKPLEMNYDVSQFDNVTGLVGSSSNYTEYDNTTDTVNVTTPIRPNRFYDMNDTEENQDTNFESDEYGIGIHFLGYKIKGNNDYHCVFWARNKVTSIQRWFRLNFDPTTDHRSYTINLKKKNVDLESSLDISLIIGDDEVVSVGGFKFSSYTRFAFATWNENDYLPPIDDIYNPFYATAVLTSIDVPDEVHKPCLDGLGFYDGESGIKSISLGVSDSENEVGNVAPLTLFKSFCFPCIEPCKELCQETCTDNDITDGFTIIPLHLDSLTLETTDISDGCLNSTTGIECNTTVYYLNVQMTNFAGKEVVVHSNGIQIDVTPPDCEYVRCLDPDYSTDEPTDHIGSSATLGGYWRCDEDISQISRYLVRILTGNGTVLMDTTSVGLNTKSNFTLKNGTFENEKDYEFELTAVNVGGLSSVLSCFVHVNLYPPDTSGASSNAMFIDGSASISDDSPLWTLSQTSVGITWNGGSNDTEFYEWTIGAEEGGSEIFPAIKVGKDRMGSSSIEHGKINFNREHTNKSVGEFIDTRNMSADAVANLSLSDSRETSFFNMEPGRCMFQSLEAIGYSHLKSKIKSSAVCVKRVGDVYISASKSKTMNIYKSKQNSSWSSHSIGSNTQVSLQASLTSGGLTIGSVTSADKQADYGSAATFDFQPFISNLKQTEKQTSRLLRKRIIKSCDLSFFVSPAPHAEFNNIGINISVNSDCIKDKDNQPALIYWDIERQEWKHIDEGCQEFLTALFKNGTYITEVCPAVEKRSRRSATPSTNSLAKPRAYDLVLISRSFPNTAPQIVTSVVSFIEDKSKEIIVRTRDDENDTLILEIVKQPDHANCVIISNSTVNCTFVKDFYGDDYITLRITEDGLPPYEDALSHEMNVRLVVSGQPDPTERFFIDRDGHMHRSKPPSMKHVVIENANGTSELYVGTIILADVDGDEVFRPQPRFRALGNATYTLKQIDTSEMPLRKTISMSSKYRTIIAYTVYLTFSPKLHGDMQFDFIAENNQGAKTPSVTLNIYILEFPCVYGQCNHALKDKFACTDIARAKSFDDFYCECRPGYEGQWCQIETNECQDEPCALMFDCEDLINEYKCNINIPKLMAILICSIIAVGGAVFVIYKCIRRYKMKKLSDSQTCLQQPDKVAKVRFQGLHTALSRPVTSGSIMVEDTDIDPKPSNSLPDIWTRPVEKTGDDIDMNVISALSAIASTKIPPHHQSYKTGSKMAGKPGNVYMSQQNKALSKLLDGNTKTSVASLKSVESDNRVKSSQKSKTGTDAGTSIPADSIDFSNKPLGSTMQEEMDSRSEEVTVVSPINALACDKMPLPVLVKEIGSRSGRVTSASSARSMRSESSIIILGNGANSITDIDV